MAGDDRQGYVRLMDLFDLSPLMANFGQYACRTLIPFSPNTGILLASGENPAPWGTALGTDTVPHGARFWGSSVKWAQNVKYHYTNRTAGFCL